MNNYLLFAITILGVVATVQYFLGVKKNRWLGKTMSVQAENIFLPKDTEYINIGGAIGYNFVYKLKSPWKEVKGTFTFVPRHSLFYVPISMLIGNADRFFLNIFTDKKLIGEGHIVEMHHLRRAKIDEIDTMQSDRIERGGKTFVLFWRYGNLKDTLLQTLEAMPDPSSLAHFCCFRDNKTFFLYLKPKKGEIADNLKAFLACCPRYFRQENNTEDQA